MRLRQALPHQRSFAHFGLASARGLIPLRIVRALIAAVSLVFSGCATHGYKVVSVAYDYTDQNREARERAALRDAQDDCYFEGYEYAQRAGPPQIVADGAAGSAQFQATESFYCIGERGEG